MTSPAERVAELRSAVAGLDREDVQAISLPLPDATRQAALAAAVLAAADAGRSQELESARERMRDEALVRYRRAMLRPTWLGLNWGLSSGPASDQVAIAAALDEAAVLAVTEDLLDDDDRATLAWAPSILLTSSAHAGDSGSLGRALSGAARGRAWVWGTAIVVVASLVSSLALGFGAAGVGLLVAGILFVVWLARREAKPPAAR